MLVVIELLHVELKLADLDVLWAALLLRLCGHGGYVKLLRRNVWTSTIGYKCGSVIVLLV